MKLPLTGCCQCRSIRYRVTAQPRTIYACHCTECQRQSGSAFGISMLVPRGEVAFTAGTPQTWQRTADSGRKIDCKFCGTCGMRLVHFPQHSPNLATIRGGTLDDTSGIRLAGHIWTRSRQPWFAIPADGVNYERQPPNLDALFEAYSRA